MKAYNILVNYEKKDIKGLFLIINIFIKDNIFIF